MANKVTVEVTGKDPQTINGVSTVGEVMTKLGVENYAATVNGEPADKSYELSDFEYVTLAPQVKGAYVTLAQKVKGA